MPTHVFQRRGGQALRLIDDQQFDALAATVADNGVATLLTLARRGGAVGQDQELAACVSAPAQFERRAPVLHIERACHGHSETSFGGKLREVAEHIVTWNQTRLPARGANTKPFLVEIGDAHDPTGIAVDGLDQVGQHIWRKRDMQNQIRRSPCDIPNPLRHTVAIGRDLRAEVSQAARKGIAGGCDHMRSSHQRYLNGGKAYHRPTTVYQDGLAGRHAEQVETANRRLDRHRQRSRFEEAQAIGNRRPEGHDRIFRCAGSRVTHVIGNAEDEVSDTDIRDAFPNGINGPGNIQPDPAWQSPRQGRLALLWQFGEPNGIFVGSYVGMG